MDKKDTTLYSPPPITEKYTGYIPDHWGQDSIALLPKGNGRLCLDHGCGDGRSRKLIEAFGWKWVGVDIEGNVSLICDGHYLPFKSNTFDHAISNAVFEHLYDPFQAAREIFRVMKPGAYLQGEVAFQEPFHANSYFHMSHMGTKQMLTTAGFEVIRLWPTWHLFEAQMQNMFPVPIVSPTLRFVARWTAKGLMAGRALGLKQVSKMKGRDAEEIQRRLEIDRLSYTGSVAFFARKPA